MKKLHLLTLLVVLLLAGCNKDDLGGGETPTGPDNTEFLSPTHFYGKATFPETKGVAQRDNLWYPGTTIKVKLLNDPLGKAAQIETWAKEWEEFADIKFDFITDGDAHVRVGFDWNANRWVTWSYIGTDCKMVYDQTEATMSFAYWDYASEEEMRGDVLRAFGQVLGLELEHRHLDFDPAWTANIERYWASEINDVPWEILKKYVFDALDAANTLQTDEYDPESIMIWPFARQYAGNTERYYNYELSEMDKAFVGTLYPKSPIEEVPHVLLLTVQAGTELSFDILTGKELQARWDGSDQVRIIPASDSAHTIRYDVPGTSGTQTLRVYGDAQAVTYLYLSRSGRILSQIDVRGSVALESLYASNIKSVETLDLSCNPQLRMVNTTGGSLKSIVFAENSALKSLYCYDNQIEQLDLRHCPLLTNVYCSDNPLTTLHLPRPSQLSDLDCSQTKISSLELIDMPALSTVRSDNCSELQTLTVRSTPRLALLYVSHCNLSVLDLSDAVSLTQLHCHNNRLSHLDVSSSSGMYFLYCYNNQLTGLDLSGKTRLIQAYCYNNQLTSLDVSGCANLSTLDARNNQLPSLDLTNNLQLKTLYLSNNQLYELLLTYNVLLTELHVDGNRISVLTFGEELTRLNVLNCAGGFLPELDVSHLPFLQKLYAGDSWIQSLDFSHNPYLYYVDITDNPIMMSREEMIRMAESLPVRADQAGSLFFHEEEAAQWIRAICDNKNWNIYHNL